MKLILGAAATLMAGAIAASANAAVLYSLSGTIGDSNWTADGSGQYLLDKSFFNLPPSPSPPAFAGAAGTFSTSAAQYVFKFSTGGDVVGTFAFDDFYIDGGELVVGPMGGQFSAYGGSGIDGGGQVASTDTQHTFSFQLPGAASSTFIDEGYVVDDIPPDDTFHDPVTGELYLYDTSTAALDTGWDIVATGAGQPFSIVLYSSAPEPMTWSLMIAGFATIGAPLRMSRRRRAAAATG